MKRSIRRWLDTTKTRAAAADINVAPTIGTSGTAPMKATTSTIAAITIADPRSAWTRQVPAANPASRSSGLRLRRTSDRSSLRRTRRSAENTTTASLRNSEGWIVNSPKAIHALASLSVTPIDENGASIPSPATTRAGHGEPAQPQQVDAQGDEEPDHPDSRPHQLPVEQEERAPPRCAWAWAVAESTITRPSMRNAVTTTART